MKKTAIALVLGVALVSCNNKEKKTAENPNDSISTTTVEQPKASGSVSTTNVDWESIPEAKEIGNFPFFKPSKEFKILDEKDGLSEVFENEKLENYTGKDVYTTEGKLGVLVFENVDGQNFSRSLFEKNINDYMTKIGAKQLYKGDYPANETANEALRDKLKENLWNGKHRTIGLSDDEPFAVYAFKNNGKNYVVNVQYNSAQGYIFIMELKA
ncbi:hypothetical protein [Pedobacter roseus]|uniref:Lipoprotein n=1 Tax=Pedobacter roseus TaxID=336820 RepID=A0A7G9QGW6_9SPHI|nr:hypothetical protein [Pedobacter roseus]QNN42591.1 hypothetical protein H9L23_00270 [Pedobacter roseus]